MKKAAALVVLLALLCCRPCSAWDGELFFGWQDGNGRAYPAGGEARWISGLELENNTSLFGFELRPWLLIETMMDGYNGDGTFAPAGVRYELGVEYPTAGGLAFEAKHSCWHGVDRIGGTEQFNAVIVKYRFSGGRR